MKKITFVGIAIVMTMASKAQRADVNTQTQVMHEYSSEHYNTASGSHVDVSNNGGTVKETWVSDNGDKNTISRDNNTNETTTTVEHPDNSRETNGVTEGQHDGGNHEGSNSDGHEGGGNSDGGNHDHAEHEGHAGDNK